MKKIIVLGCSKRNSIAFKVMRRLKKEFPKIEFKEVGDVEDVDCEGKDLDIIDTVPGIERVTLIDDIDDLHINKSCSTSDSDRPLALRILKKMNIIESVRIVGIPPGYDAKRAAEEASTIIRQMQQESPVRKD